MNLLYPKLGPAAVRCNPFCGEEMEFTRDLDPLDMEGDGYAI